MADPVVRRRVSISEFGPSRTKVAPAGDCDVNTIVERYRTTGVLTHVSRKAPIFADVSNVQDYLTSWNMIKQAEAEFMALPARVRERFLNDPQQLIAFVKDPANRDEAIELGLVPKPEGYVAPVKSPEGDKKADKP